MSSNEEREDVIHTKIWYEEPSEDNPFAADACYCAGYDVYGDLLGKASWIEYLYLLFKQERPSEQQARLFELIAIALANPGPRDYSIRAAMTASVGGSLSASCLMAALGPGAGGYTGGREMFLAMQNWQNYGRDLSAWQATQPQAADSNLEVWPEIEHTPGFDPYGASTTQVVINTLQHLNFAEQFHCLQWLQDNRSALEAKIGAPLSLLGVISAAFVDLEFDAEQAEMLYMLLRLPGAAAHALEQRPIGHKRYPFFKDGLKLTNDPKQPSEKS